MDRVFEFDVGQRVVLCPQKDGQGCRSGKVRSLRPTLGTIHFDGDDGSEWIAAPWELMAEPKTYAAGGLLL